MNINQYRDTETLSSFSSEKEYIEKYQLAQIKLRSKYNSLLNDLEFKYNAMKVEMESQYNALKNELEYLSNKVNAKKERNRLDFIEERIIEAENINIKESLINKNIKEMEVSNENWAYMASQQKNNGKIVNWMSSSLKWPISITSKIERKISTFLN